MICASIIPSHDIATWLLEHIDGLLDRLGLAQNSWVEDAVYFVTILTFSILIGWILRKIILKATQYIVKLRGTAGGTELLNRKVLTRCSHIIPPLVFLGLIPFAFADESSLLTIIERVAFAYLMVTIAIGVNSLLAFVFFRFIDHENTKNLPWRGTLNVAQGVVWVVVVIISVSVLIDKSPMALLTGLGAFAAALMLIFKDSILGFVAGIQMSQNDMLRVGDWVVVHGTDANGVVTDVSLTTVKVRNWDNTMVMVPPYTLVSTSFQNYRGMYESGVRRIDSTLNIAADSVRSLTPAMLSEICEKVPQVKPFVDDLQKKGITAVDNSGTAPVNGTLQTNLGLFRAYAVTCLLADPEISNDNDLMVRLLPPTEFGLPLGIYCFTTTTAWSEHESIRSRVLEHLTTMAPIFGLRIFSRGTVNVEETRSPAITTSAAQS